MGERIVLTNVRQRFADARTLCPGMTSSMYELTDYISQVFNDELDGHGLTMSMTLVYSGLKSGRDLFTGKALPENLLNDSESIMTELLNMPQVVDEIADKEFAESFRNSFERVFKEKIRKRIQLYPGKDYPGNVKAAVNWWAEAIQSPKLDNGEELPSLIMSLVAETKRTYTVEEIREFQNALAELIYKQLSEYDRCELYVDYEPCPLLAEAGNLIDINGRTGYPWKTDMIITNEIVEVKSGYGEPLQKIWSKENALDEPADGKQKR